MTLTDRLVFGISAPRRNFKLGDEVYSILDQDLFANYTGVVYALEEHIIGVDYGFGRWFYAREDLRLANP